MAVMKTIEEIPNVDILKKIGTIEKEIVDLKLSVLKKLAPVGKKVIKLKGILKGVQITDSDICSAKKIKKGNHRRLPLHKTVGRAKCGRFSLPLQYFPNP
jgi:hypothetical protein